MIADYLNQTVRYRPPAAENDWSEATYGAVELLPARVEERERRVTTPGGIEVTTDTIVYLGREIKVGGQINTLDADLENYRTIQGRETEGPDIDGEVSGWRALL